MGRGGGRALKAISIVDGRLELVERDDPEPRAHQVLVEVAGAGVNRADLMQRAGAYPAPRGWPVDIPGLEFAGTVAATGNDVWSLQVGDRVFGVVGGGGQATHLVTPANHCARAPRALDLVEAGGVPEVWLTAHDAMLVQAGLRPGERVLIHGVGSGVGTAAVQLARAIGATTVGTSRTPEKLDRAKGLGLDEGVVASADMAARIGEVDVVIDLVGGDYIRTDVEVCRPKGRIVLVGLLAGAATELDLGTFMRKRLRLMGTALRSRPDHEKALATATFEREVAPLFERGALHVPIDEIVPLAEAERAYERMASNDTFGKVVLATKEG